MNIAVNTLVGQMRTSVSNFFTTSMPPTLAKQWVVLRTRDTLSRPLGTKPCRADVRSSVVTCTPASACANIHHLLCNSFSSSFSLYSRAKIIRTSKLRIVVKPDSIQAEKNCERCLTWLSLVVILTAFRHKPGRSAKIEIDFHAGRKYCDIGATNQ